MPRYIVETLSTFRHVHVIEAESKEKAFEIADKADYNWEEYLGLLKIDINEYSEEQAKVFKEKPFFWAGVSYEDENGEVTYKNLDK
jgi:hypothetical protein